MQLHLAPSRRKPTFPLPVLPLPPSTHSNSLGSPHVSISSISHFPFHSLPFPSLQSHLVLFSWVYFLASFWSLFLSLPLYPPRNGLRSPRVCISYLFLSVFIFFPILSHPQINLLSLFLPFPSLPFPSLPFSSIRSSSLLLFCLASFYFSSLLFPFLPYFFYLILFYHFPFLTSSFLLYFSFLFFTPPFLSFPFYLLYNLSFLSLSLLSSSIIY